MARKAAAYVACNVYVTGGGRQAHVPILLDVLDRAQRRCRVLSQQLLTPDVPEPANQQQQGIKNPVAIVHAFADTVYDRSSFHIAGRSDFVSDVATVIATQALNELSRSNSKHHEDGSDPSRHPFVGVVDHVSVMPLINIKYDDSKVNRDIEAGEAAKEIGDAMSKIGATVYFYGSADPSNTPLAKVRRESTHFFQSGGLDEKNGIQDDSSSRAIKYGYATVGAPQSFVENFNIRLKATCTKEKARTLTKALRERDGGIIGVEALTLPYSKGRHEVACNLLRPDEGSSEMISDVAMKWAKDADCIEKAYRVGTTAAQCLEVLSNTDLTGSYDKEVRRHLAQYLASSD